MIKSLEATNEEHKYPRVEYQGVTYECMYWIKTSGKGLCSGLCDKCEYAVELKKEEELRGL